MYIVYYTWKLQLSQTILDNIAIVIIDTAIRAPAKVL